MPTLTDASAWLSTAAATTYQKLVAVPAARGGSDAATGVGAAATGPGAG